MKVVLPRHLAVLALALAMIGAMTALVWSAPALYRAFCQVTGYGGTTQRATAFKPAIAADASAGPEFTIMFDSNVAPGLDWSFQPSQRKVTVRPGVPTKIYYEATNLTNAPLVAHATFNVTPYEVAPYFFKIQCFCFTDERLGPHETARMPVVFYVDGQMLKDLDAKEIRQITLSYTFFKQKDLSTEQVSAARDLNKGSVALDASLGAAKVQYDNDAPRE